jgi:hypothetical protein
MSGPAADNEISLLCSPDQALAEELSRRLRQKSASGLSAQEFMQRAQQPQQPYSYDSPPLTARTVSAAATAAAAAEAAWRVEEAELEEPVLAQQPSAAVHLFIPKACMSPACL